jgi:hypothetical protein
LRKAIEKTAPVATIAEINRIIKRKINGFNGKMHIFLPRNFVFSQKKETNYG